MQAERNTQALQPGPSVARSGPSAIVLSLPAAHAATASGTITWYRPSDSGADRVDTLALDTGGRQQVSNGRAGPWTLAAAGQVGRRGTQLLLRGTGHRAMTALVTGLIFGAAGSLHCVGMCGPLVLTMGRGLRRPSRRAQLQHALTYHTGRVLTYVVLGSMAGLDRGNTVDVGTRPCPGDHRRACCSSWRPSDPSSRAGCEDGEPRPPRSPPKPVPWLAGGAGCIRSQVQRWREPPTGCCPAASSTRRC